MGNIACAPFEKPIPLPLVKSVEILASDVNPSITKLKILLSLQAVKIEEGHSFGLFVALINDDKVLSLLKENPSALKYEIVNKDTPSTKSSMIKKYIGVEDFVTDGKIRHIINKRDGTGVITKELSMDVDLYLADGQNLWLYCVAYEMDNEAENFNVTATPQNKKFAIGTPAIETIMRNGHAMPTTYLYTLGDTVEGYGTRGDVWVGPVHRKGRTYMAGDRHDPSKDHPTLQRLTVSNQKIKDLRLLNHIENLNLDNFTINMRNINKTDFRNFERVKQMVGKRYFSRLRYSRSSTGDFKLWFALDYDAFINDHCRLANVFTNKGSLRSTYAVSNITVFRQKKENYTDGSKLAFHLNAESQKKVLESPIRIGDLKKGNIVPFNTSKDGFVNFLINDSHMKRDEINIYEYTVNFEFVDNSALVVHEMVQALEREFVKFQSFLSNFEALGKKNFDIQEYLRANAGVIKTNDSWLKLINKFVASVWFFFGQSGFGGQKPILWKKNLTTMVNPMSATEESLREFTELIKDYINDLQYLVSKSAVGRSDAKFSARSKIGSTRDLVRKIKYTHVPRRVRKRSENNVGFDYLGLGAHAEESPTSFTKISYDSLINRLNGELRKYQVGNPNVPTINKYGFLSPSSIHTPYEIQPTTRSDLELSDGLVILDNKVNPGINLFSADGAIADLDVKISKMQCIQGSAGITFEPLRTSLVDYVEARKEPAPDQKDVSSEDYLAIGGFPEEITAAESPVSASQEASLTQLQFSRRAIEVLEADLSERMLDGIAQNFTTPRLRRTTAVEGSLALARIKQNMEEFLDINSFQRDINYNSLVTIQFLDGYQRGDIRRPRWRQLSEGRFREMKAAGSTVLCRLRRCPSITGHNSYRLSRYNYLFMLQAEEDFQSDENIIKTSYKARYRKYYKSMTHTNRGTTTNINRGAANYGPEYCVSGAMIFKIKSIRIRKASRLRGRRVTVASDKGPPATKGAPPTKSMKQFTDAGESY
jgi:hypothetical protein|tara:strand:+ start:5220 stop:8198 length:2979 start_codon:yes stop_codon:yes gene_type:complete